jgi:hypothetical protein
VNFWPLLQVAVVTSLIAAIVRDVRVALVTSASVAGSSYPAKTTGLVTGTAYVTYMYSLY